MSEREQVDPQVLDELIDEEPDVEGHMNDPQSHDPQSHDPQSHDPQSHDPQSHDPQLLDP